MKPIHSLIPIDKVITMPKTVFTPQQERAIATRDCDLLVSAAAGSGKTAVLVERIIRIITNEQKPVDIDRLLVVTFTEAAAAEMRQRILKGIEQRLSENPDSVHLQKQAMLINNSSIMTIHSFCLSVIRKYFYLIDIDPSFRIVDGAESDLLKAEIMRDLFEQLYESDDEEFLQSVFGSNDNSDFLNLVSCFGDKIKDDGLQELALKMFDFIQSCPWPESWLLYWLDKLDLQSIDELEQTDWYKYFAEDARISLSGCLSSVDIVEGLCRHPQINPAAIQVLEDDRQKLTSAMKSLDSGFSAFYQAMAFSFATMRLAIPGKKSSDDDEETIALKQLISDIRTADIKKPVSDMQKKALSLSPEGIVKNISFSCANIRTLCKVVIAFSKRFYDVKRARNIADFGDFEHLCIKALTQPDSGFDKILPSIAAMELRQKFNEVLTDEYQDSNLVQELILSLVSKNRDARNRFMVGDIKQSIYRFRMANPELFREKYYSYGTNEGDLEQRIDLSKNFRSRKSVLCAINFIFKQIMTDYLGEVIYDEDAMLYYGADYLPFDDANAEKTEVLVLDTSETGKPDDNTDIDAETEDNTESVNEQESDEIIAELTNAELEATMVANRIKQLLGADSGKPFQVTEKDGFRDIEPRDIVILLRSTRNVADAYVRALGDIDLPSFSDTSTGYFESMEIMTILSLLRIVDNPRQDIHLISALYSSVYGVTADELLSIRQCLARGMFYDCVLEYTRVYEDSLSQKLCRFLSDLDRWRNMAVYMSISELLQAIYGDSGYFDYAGTMPGGAVRQANLRALFERAVRYEKTRLKSLFNFIMYIEKIQKGKTEFGSAKVISENENVVRVMSIHKSKGLEFPVVFVCGLGRRFNLSDATSPVLLHQKLGVGAVSIDSDLRIKYNTLSRYAISKKIIIESLSEEMRVLYVALTRAKEKIILSACIKDIARRIDVIKRYSCDGKPAVNPYFLSKKRCFFDWIISALLRHRDIVKHLSVETERWNEKLFNDESRWSIAINKKSDFVANSSKDGAGFDVKQQFDLIDKDKDYSGRKNEITNNISFVYPYSAVAEIPSKISISEIKRINYELQTKDSESFYSPKITDELRRPDFLQSGKSRNIYTPARKGVLLHAVMEHLDVSMHHEYSEIKKLIHSLTAKGIFSEEDAQHIDIKKIEAFSQSSLADRMRKSKNVMKEIPFVLGMKPEEINPSWVGCKNERVLVHGIIDCLFEEEDGFVLLDYKSDKVMPSTAETVLERYKIQIGVYKRAVLAAMNGRLKQSVIYFFELGRWFEV